MLMYISVGYFSFSFDNDSREHPDLLNHDSKTAQFKEGSLDWSARRFTRIYADVRGNNLYPKIQKSLIIIFIS